MRLSTWVSIMLVVIIALVLYPFRKLFERWKNWKKVLVRMRQNTKRYLKE